MVVSVIALVVALSGTAVAASKLVSGDKLIKKRSLSGNRLRDRTVTGRQIKISSLGKVPSAKNADHAASADHASSADRATNATNATNAGNASTLGGQAANAFDTSGNWFRSGLVTAAGGQTVPIASFPPFTLSLQCTDDGGGAFTANVQATSSESNTVAFDTVLTPGTPTTISSSGSSTTFQDNQNNSPEFIAASGKTYEGILMDAVHFPGVSNPCVANVLVGKS
jgi:hypothetical protein